MSMKKKFLLFVAVPATVLTIASVSASAFTFGQNVSVLTADKETVEYLAPATIQTSLDDSYTFESSSLGRGAINNTVGFKYGELPQWSQTSIGQMGVPSTIHQAGDLLLINARSSTMNSSDNNNGRPSPAPSQGNSNVVQSLFVKGAITNIASLREVYRSCLIPIRLWSSTDSGENFTDRTADFFDTQEGEPFYLDCDSGQFSFTVPTAAAAYNKTRDLDYEVTVEQGGNFATMNDGPAAEPEFVFNVTPITASYSNNIG